MEVQKNQNQIYLPTQIENAPLYKKTSFFKQAGNFF